MRAAKTHGRSPRLVTLFLHLDMRNGASKADTRFTETFFSLLPKGGDWRRKGAINARLRTANVECNRILWSLGKPT